jgi:redox-sensitive bicupin YhaK (pirin superfamily)
MSQKNPIRRLMPADMVDMGGMPVRQPLPTRQVNQIDPFLLLHHHVGKVKGGRRQQEVGIGPHPHRGFSPVTFIFQGDVHHRDSRGNSSVVKAGGVQWMDAGMGIIHSERPSAELAIEGGTQEILQLWLNLPKSQKLIQPHYQAITKDDQPQIPLLSGEGRIGLISGEWDGLKGKVDSKLPVNSAMGELKKGAEFEFKKPAGWNGFVYLLDGKLRLEGFGQIEGLNLAQLNPDGESFTFEALEDTRLIYVAAQPLDEEVSQYGPFVMNTQTEIMEAIRDYQQGKMGVLVEEFN